MLSCAICGRQNEPGSRFCMDCGKPLTASAMAVPAILGEPVKRVPGAGGEAPKCSSCGHEVDASLSFCAHCGAKLEALVPATAPVCPKCATPITDPKFRFCPACATPLKGATVGVGAPPHEATSVFSAKRQAAIPVELVVLKDDGSKGSRHPLTGDETSVGRLGADVSFGEDTFLSPKHALFIWKDGKLSLRDLGSRNGTWVFLAEPHKLVDGDLILMGSQLIRFRRLGYPGPHPPEADATRRMGSLVPSADIASLSQLRADGSVRDVFHLSPGRDIALGRDRGDWVFPYDPSMSGSHAAVKSEDADFVLTDAGSRNGVAIAVRGDHALAQGAKVLLGDKLLLVEMS